MPATTDVIKHISTTGITTTYTGRAVMFVGPNSGVYVKKNLSSLDTQIPITTLESLYTTRWSGV